MNTNIWLTLILSLMASFIFSQVHITQTQNEEKNSDDEVLRFYWYSRVSMDALNSKSNQLKLNETDADNVIKGIEILLTFEGDKGEAVFCGATDVKYNSPNVPCTVEIGALFYASYIFYGKEWDHFAKGIALVENNEMNSPQTIKKAYKHYRKWFKKIKEIGLEEARRQGLDPLIGTGIGWHGGAS